MELDGTQRQAVELCVDLTKRAVGVTGQAGTGKTTIIRTAVQQLVDKYGPVVAVVAPTGKAARRIKELTGLPSTTIHKLLEYPRPDEYDAKTGKPLDSGHPKRNRANPIYQRVVFADEYAMVNHELHNNLLAALPRGGAIRCFGDLNQLPPIEEYKIKTEGGSPFKRVLDDQPSVKLEHVFRQAEGSDVLNAATNIRQGIMPRKGGDFQYHITTNPLTKLEDLVMEAEDAGRSFQRITRQIITPTNKKGLGTRSLNVLLRGLLNPSPTFEISLPRHKWHEEAGTPELVVGIGDKVVCTSNTYDLRPYEERYMEWDHETDRPMAGSFILTPDTHMMLNGETGIILDIHPDESLEIDFGDRVVIVPAKVSEFWAKANSIIDVDHRKNIELAYALTTHKCQGSEYDEVIYVVGRSQSFSLGRENFYTAVTRARKRVDMVTDQPSLVKSVRSLVRS